MAQLSVIAQLYRAGQLSPTELAHREGVRIQTLTRLLAELEAHGWLRRVPHKLDRRQFLLSLTPEGKKRLVDATRARVASLAKIIEATLNTEEQALLLRACGLLDRLDEALGSPSDSVRETTEAKVSA